MKINSINHLIMIKNQKQLKKSVKQNIEKNKINCYNSKTINRGMVMFSGINSVADNIQKWTKQHNINERTMEACKTAINNLKKEESEEYKIIENINIIPNNIKFVIDETLDRKAENYITSTLSFQNKSDNNEIGYYTALFDLKGKIFDDILNIY